MTTCASTKRTWFVYWFLSLLLVATQGSADSAKQPPQDSADKISSVQNPTPSSEGVPAEQVDEAKSRIPVSRKNSARTYQLDRDAGKIRFGDGQHGRIPEAKRIKNDSYRTGAGTKGKLSRQPKPGLSLDPRPRIQAPLPSGIRPIQKTTSKTKTTQKTEQSTDSQ